MFLAGKISTVALGRPFLSSSIALPKRGGLSEPSCSRTRVEISPSCSDGKERARAARISRGMVGTIVNRCDSRQLAQFCQVCFADADLVKEQAQAALQVAAFDDASI